jgi:hypothetical protein
MQNAIATSRLASATKKAWRRGWVRVLDASDSRRKGFTRVPIPKGARGLSCISRASRARRRLDRCRSVPRPAAPIGAGNGPVAGPSPRCAAAEISLTTARWRAIHPSGQGPLLQCRDWATPGCRASSLRRACGRPEIERWPALARNHAIGRAGAIEHAMPMEPSATQGRTPNHEGRVQMAFVRNWRRSHVAAAADGRSVGLSCRRAIKGPTLPT